MLTQTRRHSYIVSLLGIRHVVLAVNKMDAVDYDQATFDAIVADYRGFAQQVGLSAITCIPMSALKGENITTHSDKLPWYRGPALMEHLETVKVEDRVLHAPFRLPVQWVNRPNMDFRGFTGQIASGQIEVGDRVRALPSGKEATIARIVTYDGDLPRAQAGQSITLTLDREIDVSRGDLLTAAAEPAGVADQFQTTLIWMHEQPMLPGRQYLLKIGARTVNATLATPKYRVNVNTLDQQPAQQLELNEIGVCNVTLDSPVAFDPYAENRETGGLHPDRQAQLRHRGCRAAAIRHASRGEHPLAGAGCEPRRPFAAEGPACLRAVVHRSVGCRQVDHRQPGRKAAARAGAAHLPAGWRQRAPWAQQRSWFHRCGSRREHPSRGGSREADGGCRPHRAGVVHLAVPLRTPHGAREKLASGEFIEIHVDTSLAEAEKRDPKGLYRKARSGELRTSPASTRPMNRPSMPRSRFAPPN